MECYINKKKGFTLIELLAVIVVLAVILLIVSLIVVNVIEDARKGAFKNSAYGIIKTAEQKFINNVLAEKRTGITFVYNDSIESSYPIGYKLDYRGTRPESGQVIINNSGQVGISLFNGKWCAIKGFDDEEVRIENLGEEECLQSIPLVTIELIGNEIEYVEINTSYEDKGALARTIDGDIISTIDKKIKYDNNEVDSINVGKLGIYEILYTVIYNDYKVEKTRRVIVRDTIPPQLTIPSNVTLKVEEVSSYDFMNGVEVSDNSLEDIKVTMSGNVASLPGQYTITYRAKDSSGNETAKVRYITVIDTGYPVITILGNNPANINVGTTYVDAGATAIDDVDGDITSKIVTTGTVNVNVVGAYAITYQVTDNAGNTTTVTRTVNVIDNVPPVVTFGTNGNSTYAKSRSTTVTVSDVHSSVNTSSLKYLWSTSTTTPSETSFSTTFTNGGTINSPSGVTGGYYLWILAKDREGNTTITRSNVFNLDNTGPVISGITIDASNITSSGFTITRSGNATDANSGLATNPYIYQISTNGSSWITKCTNNSTSCVVTGLNSSTQYYYRVCVNDLLSNQSCITSKNVSTIEPHYYYDKYTISTQANSVLTESNRVGYYDKPKSYYLYQSVYIEWDSDLKEYRYIGSSGKSGSFGTTIPYGYTCDIINNSTYYKYKSYDSNVGSFVYDIYKIQFTEVRGNLVQSNIIAPIGTYPDNGKYSDGYWYVKKSLAE